MKKPYIYLLFILIVSCNSKDSESEPKVNFNTKDLIADITKNIIVPSVEKFKDDCVALDGMIVKYLNDISESNLETAKNQWKTTARAYANIYAFNIGKVKDEFTHLSLYNWPTNGIAIENFIKKRAVVAEEIKIFGSQAKTLSGVEYLLFNENIENTNKKFTNNSKRGGYLKFISKELKERAEKLSNKWSVNGENYLSIFIDNDKTGIESSLNILFNGIYNVVNTAKVSKLGKPAGLENSYNTRPKEIQAPYSKLSVDLMIENIKSVEKVIFNPKKLGLSDNIKSITKNEKLNEKLKSQIKKTISALEDIDTPLETAIENDKETIKKAYDELKILDILLSTDVRSILSIIITSTDNDGD